MPLKLVLKLAQGDQRLMADASGKLELVAGEGTRLEADRKLVGSGTGIWPSA
jgi:hypothetical protein